MSEKLIHQLTEIQEIGFGIIQEPDDHYAQQVFVIVKADEFVEGEPEEIQETIREVLAELLSEQVVLSNEFYTDSYKRLVKDLQKKMQRQPQEMFAGTRISHTAKQLVESYDNLEGYPDISIRDLDLECLYFYRFSWDEDGFVPERTTCFILAEELIRQLETDGKPPAVIETFRPEKKRTGWPKQEETDWAVQKEREWEDNFDDWIE